MVRLEEQDSGGSNTPEQDDTSEVSCSQRLALGQPGAAGGLGLTLCLSFPICAIVLSLCRGSAEPRALCGALLLNSILRLLVVSALIFLSLLLFLCVCIYVWVHMGVCVLEARRGNRIPWN